MDALRTRLQAVKQDILQSSIASQTEATRDNTHRLERIQAELKNSGEASRRLETAVKRLTLVSVGLGIVYYAALLALLVYPLLAK